MKKMILMIAFVTGMGAIANAQTRQHKTPQQRAEMMSKKLNLTKEQSAKVTTILVAQAASVDSLKATKTTDKRQAFGTVWQNTDKKLNAVLTADQQKAYAELKTARKGKMKGDFKAHSRIAPAQKAERITKKLQEKLKLTPDQSAKVSTILLAQATRIDSLKANKVQGDKKLNREAFKSIRKSTDDQLGAVFNSDQKKAYDEIKASRKHGMKGKRHGAENKEG